MRHLRIRQQGRPSPNLSATFRQNGGGLGQLGGGSVSFDAALDLIDQEQKRRDRGAQRKKQTAAGGFASMKQMQAVANMLASGATKRGKIKMPSFSIQRKEIDGE